MKAKRAYTNNDTGMYSAITKMMLNFEKDIADFTALYPSMDATFLNNWKTAFEEVNALFPIHDMEQTVTSGIILKADADKTLNQCRAKYKEVKFYAGRAFPGNKEILKEFGEGAYSKVQHSRLRMVQFMETLHGVADKYKTELIAASYTQPAIDHILTLATELRNDNNAQQLKKKQRPTETRKRIEAMNNFYGFGQQVAQVSQIIYRNDSVKRNLYLLAQRHHSAIAKSWLKIGTGALRKVSLTGLLKKYKSSLGNQSTETIQYWYADNTRQTPEQKFPLTGGETIELTAPSPARKFLVLHNTSQKEVRVVLVKEEKERK